MSMQQYFCNNLQKIYVPPKSRIIQGNDEKVRMKDMALRMHRVKHSQIEYENLFRKVNFIIDELKFKFPSTETLVHYSDNSDDDDESDEDEYFYGNYYKRRRFHTDSGFYGIEFNNPFRLMYPKAIVETNQIIIGPNGTIIPASTFAQITWETTYATRSLLSCIFSNDILATHTLTGKPSPAFRGSRERPAKLQLDAAIIDDIIYCVQIQCGSNKRDIRAVITMKCADTAKKYRRRSLALGF